MSLIADALKKAQKVKIQQAQQKPIPEGIIIPGGQVRASDSGSLRKVFQKRIIVFTTAFGIFIFFFLFFTLSVQRKIKKVPVIKPVKIATVKDTTPKVPTSQRVSKETGVAKQAPPDKPVSPVADARGDEAKTPEPPLIHPSPALAEKKDQEPAPPSEKKREKTEEQPPISFLDKREKEAETEEVINEPIAPPVQDPNLTAKAVFPPVEEGEKPEIKESSIDIREVTRHFNQGVISYKQKDLMGAIEEYKKVIQLDPRNLETLNNLGVIHKDLGKYREAREYFQKALSINPNSAKVHNNLGLINYLHGDYGKALTEYKKALASDPDNLESYTNLGVLYKKVGDLVSASDNFRKALSINPFHPETHYNLGLIYEARGEIEKSISHYKKFIQYASKDYALLQQKVKSHLTTLSRRTDPLSLGP